MWGGGGVSLHFHHFNLWNGLEALRRNHFLLSLLSHISWGGGAVFTVIHFPLRFNNFLVALFHSGEGG